MRLLLLAAAIAVAGVVALLVIDGEDPKRPRPRTGNGSGTGNGDTPTPPPRGDPLPDAGQDPEAFVAECERRGAGAVQELLELLKAGKDQQLQPRWAFHDRRLEGLPTLRAIYLDALRRVSPEALRDVLPEAKSVEESYFIALALAQTDLPGWAEPALERAAEDARPLLQEIRKDMVRLSAEKEPAVVAAYLLESAPRGEDTSVPNIMAVGLESLPEREANATATALLAEKEVTVPAKITYARALCQRADLSALRTLAEMAERQDLDERMRTEVAYLAADAGGFVKDSIDLGQAISNGDPQAAGRIRERFDERVATVRRIVFAAFNLDIDTSEDPRALALKRLLDQHRKWMPK